MNLSYISNFEKSRSQRIGSSDIIACIPHPVKPESLAGYGRTAVTVYQEKTGLRKPNESGFEAEVGKFLEPLALKKFIQEHHKDQEIAEIFIRGYLLCELDKKKDGYPDAKSFQNTPFLHHTKAETDFAIAHADCISLEHKSIIEAKTAMSWATKRPENNPFSGYDADLKGHQGIPLKHYYQVQYQTAIYSEQYGFMPDDLYLALITDTNVFHYWHFKPVKKVMERLLEISSYMKNCIDKKQPPKDLAMNQEDIKAMYPEIVEDFKVVSGETLSDAVELAKTAKEADTQMKAWDDKKKNAQDALAVILKDNKTLKGIIDGELMDIAGWTERKASERVAGLKEIKENQAVYKILQENNFINETKASRFLTVKYKGE